MKKSTFIDKKDGTKHVWFAWYPVYTVDGYLVWFERVNRNWLWACGWVYESI